MKVYFQTARRGFSSTWSDRGTRVENQGKRMLEWGNKRKRKGAWGERREKNTAALPVNVFVDSNKKRERAGVLEASSDAQETHTSHVHPFIRPSISPWRLNANVEEINWIGTSRAYARIVVTDVRPAFMIEEKHSFLQLRLGLKIAQRWYDTIQFYCDS